MPALNAAAVPNAFLTARHCLLRLGKLQRGEKVLIHSGWRRGLAAIQVAQQAGAEIFATAGSEEKRAYLRSWSFPRVQFANAGFCSRNPKHHRGKE